MDPDAERDGDGGRRQRLIRGIAIALALGLALSLTLRNWEMLIVGIALGIVLWAGSEGDGRDG